MRQLGSGSGYAAGILWTICIACGLVTIVCPGCGDEPVQRRSSVRSLEAIGAKITRQQDGMAIDIRNAPEFTDEMVDLVLEKPDIVELTMQNVPVTDAGVAKLRPLGKLGRLILNDSQITGKALDELSRMPLKDTLYSLGLKNTPISDDDLPVLAKFSGLSRLDVSGTKVTDEGMKHLVNGNYRMINLEGTEVSDAGVKILNERYPEAKIVK